MQECVESRALLAMDVMAFTEGVSFEEVCAKGNTCLQSPYELCYGLDVQMARDLYKIKPLPSPLLLRDREDYLRTVISRCDALDLTPLDETRAVGSGGAPQVLLPDVFTTIHLSGLTRPEGASVAEVIGGSPDEEARRTGMREEERYPIQAVEAVGSVPRLVVTGEPGGGKSTLVNHLSSELARRRLGEQHTPLPGWDDSGRPVPVRIVLRRFVAWCFSTVWTRCRSRWAISVRW